VPAIVGFGLACEHAVSQGLLEMERISALRAEMERGIVALGGAVFGGAVLRLANTSYFAFPGIEGETLLMALDRAGFAVASGSACSSGSPAPSAVLLAMGVAPELAKGAIRVSLGRANTRQQVQEFIAVLQVELGRLRSMLSVEMV